MHIPAHRFLHIRNYESIGYYDFWEKQSHIKGLCYDAVCRILDGINGKLDDGRGHVIAYINDAAGRICSWGIPLAEAYGIRLASDYDGPVPDGFYLMDVCEGDYIVFEHGPFDIEKESVKVESEIENRMKAFDYDEYGFCLDFRPGQVFYFYYPPECFFRYVRPIVRKSRKDKPLLL